MKKRTSFLGATKYNCHKIIHVFHGQCQGFFTVLILNCELERGVGGRFVTKLNSFTLQQKVLKDSRQTTDAPKR